MNDSLSLSFVRKDWLLAQLQKKNPTRTPGHQNHTVVTTDPSAKQAGYLSDPG